jgi:hypothetical protein
MYYLKQYITKYNLIFVRRTFISIESDTQAIIAHRALTDNCNII